MIAFTLNDPMMGAGSPLPFYIFGIIFVTAIVATLMRGRRVIRRPRARSQATSSLLVADSRPMRKSAPKNPPKSQSTVNKPSSGSRTEATVKEERTEDKKVVRTQFGSQPVNPSPSKGEPKNLSD